MNLQNKLRLGIIRDIRQQGLPAVSKSISNVNDPDVWFYKHVKAFLSPVYWRSDAVNLSGEGKALYDFVEGRIMSGSYQ